MGLDQNISTERAFCWNCHRTVASCFCAQLQPFKSWAEFALVVHPYEAKSTVGTAWILRKSISNLHWLRSKGDDLNTDPYFLSLISKPDTTPILLFPSKKAINLDLCEEKEYRALVPEGKRPLFFVIDGTWTQAHAILRKSSMLKALPRASFETRILSEYGFKKQPHPACLSCVEGVHQVIEKITARGWGELPEKREHDQMLTIFRNMVNFQMSHEKNPRYPKKMKRVP